MKSTFGMEQPIRWTVFCLVVSIVTTGFSQDFERYRPRTLPNTQGEGKLPDAPAPATGSTEVLVDQLKGLVFIDHRDKLKKGPLDGEGIVIDPASDLDLLHSTAFYNRMLPFLGQPVSMRQLNEITRQVILFYRANDLPVVDVLVPDQEISKGVVQIVVTEAVVGKVRVEDACYFDNCRLLDQVCLQPGDRIYETILNDDLRWLNRNPFREVDLVLEPGDRFGETDVLFKVRDRLPWRFYTGYEDTGTEQTQLERLFFGVNWGNAFDRDGQLAYQFTPSLNFTNLTAHSVVYSKALRNRDILQVLGSYARTKADVPAPLNLDGEAWQTSLRYYYNFCPEECRQHYFLFGFDFKRTNSNLDFGGILVSNTNADIAQLLAGYHGTLLDQDGYWNWEVDLVVGPGGGFSSGNNDAAFQTIRPFATAQYLYTRGKLERHYDLPWHLYFLGRITGQVADGNLLPSEQLGFGGYTSIRGYDMRLVNGDSGYIANLEVHTQPVTVGLDGCCDDELELLGFFDLGQRYNHDLLPGEASEVTLASLGLGLRYSIRDRLAVRADYGWQLERVPGDTKSGRFHIGVVYSR